MEPLNPYEPLIVSEETSFAPSGSIDPKRLAKIEAIINDAGQFWIAILMCIFCSGLGLLIIVPWYLARLLQWNSLAQSQPMLLDPSAPPGSIARRFQSAKIKLILGLIFAVLIFSMLVLVAMMVWV